MLSSTEFEKAGRLESQNGSGGGGDNGVWHKPES